MSQIGIGSNEYRRLKEIEATGNGPAAPSLPERNYVNDYAVYWQERSGFFTPASPADRSRQRSAERMRPGADT
jgi:hypothetical protein